MMWNLYAFYVYFSVVCHNVKSLTIFDWVVLMYCQCKKWKNMNVSNLSIYVNYRCELFKMLEVIMLLVK